MDKKEFERLAGCKVSEKYYRDAARIYNLCGGRLSPEAFVRDYYAEGADSGELAPALAGEAESLADRAAKLLSECRETGALAGRKAREAEDLRVKLDHALGENNRFRGDNQALRLKLAETAPKPAETDDAARWKAAAEGMKRRMQTMIETEIIKCGWRAVNFQPCALLLQLLREELPEFDLVAYLKELSLKYNH